MSADILGLMWLQSMGGTVNALPFVLLGVVLAAGSHCSVSRWAPPRGWGYLYGSYEVLVPYSLALAIAVPDLQRIATWFAAAVAIAIGLLSVYVASHARPAIRDVQEQAEIGRARVASWSGYKNTTAQNVHQTELVLMERDLRERVRRQHQQQHPEA